MQLQNNLTDEEFAGIDRRLKFSPSRLNSYRKCHQLGRYTYERNIEPDVSPDHESKALVLGKIVHKFLELWHGEGLHPHAVFTDVLNDFKPHQDLVISALTIMSRYVVCYNSHEFKFHATEKRLTVPYRTPNGVTVYLDGILDAIIETGLHLFGPLDHKTSARNVWREDTLVFDPQLNQYCAMLYLADMMPTIMVVNQIYTGSTDAKKIANTPQDKLFSRIAVRVDPGRIERWLSHIGRQIDFILESESKPVEKRLDSQCVWCPFRPACDLEMDGKNPEPFLNAHFVPRKQEKFSIIVDLEGIDD